jgi:hypothetical protein
LNTSPTANTTIIIAVAGDGIERRTSQVIKQFEAGKRYKFSRDAYLTNTMNVWLYNNTNLCRWWVNHCDGYEVVVDDTENGRANGWMVKPSWCQELPSVGYLRQLFRDAVIKVNEGGKTMKTLAMLNSLAENPNSKFKLTGQARKGNSHVVGIGEDGNVDWYNEKSQEFDKTYLRIYGTLDWEWELYQEPVDFMTAIKAWDKEKKTIRCDMLDNDGDVLFSNTFDGNSDEAEFGAEQILAGKWYIE